MEIEGTIILDLGVQEGVSKAGKPWKKQEWVLETLSGGMYPRRVKFTVFGENRVADLKFEMQKQYRISVDVESREFNGRWYTDVNAYAAMPLDGQAVSQPMQAMQQPMQPMQSMQQPMQPMQPMQQAPMADPFASDNTDDLPF